LFAEPRGHDGREHGDWERELSLIAALVGADAREDLLVFRDYRCGLPVSTQNRWAAGAVKGKSRRWQPDRA
jgi:hypothetical protein